MKRQCLMSFSKKDKLKGIKFIDFIFSFASLVFFIGDPFKNLEPISYKDILSFDLKKSNLKDLHLNNLRHQPVIIGFLDASVNPQPNISQLYTISPSVEQSLAMEDLDLIELLWRQDIDLGITRDSFDNKSKFDLTNGEILQIKDDRDEEDLYSNNFTIDNETGEFMPKDVEIVDKRLMQEGINIEQLYMEGQLMLGEMNSDADNIDYLAEKQAIISHWTNQPTMNSESQTIIDEMENFLEYSSLFTQQDKFQWQFTGENDFNIELEDKREDTERVATMSENIFMDAIDVSSFQTKEITFSNLDTNLFLNDGLNLENGKAVESLQDENKYLDNISFDNLLTLDNETFQQLINDNLQQDFSLDSLNAVDDKMKVGITEKGRKKYNHTYATPPGQPTKQQLRQIKLDKKESKRGSDERNAKQLGLNFNEIIECSVERFTDMCDSQRFDDKQIQLIKDIRRRGKNKLAAQNCRKRKYDELSSLEDANEEMRREVRLLRVQHQQLVEQQNTYRLASNFLHSKVFRSLRNDEDKPFDPRFYQLKQSADGEHLFLTNYTYDRQNPTD